ncbi:MAG: fused MFS/spermidine synthase [Anaerolineales bacterium]|nr:MAG: fused MFS/spermidine synthase [Anaerolineales bacterium]
MKNKSSITLYLFAALFLVSGAAGLIYQIAWERLLGLHFGVTMVSITLIVAAYMAGLGIGSLIGGRVARNLRNALLLYGILEVGIAVFGIFSPAVIVQIGQGMAGSHYALVFLISFIVLLIPTTMMGMTLPLLTQSFVKRVETSGQVIGILYGINTLGAAFGAALSGFLLVGMYGLNGSVYIAAFLNAFVGLCAFALVRWDRTQTVETESKQDVVPAPIAWGYGKILLSSFLVGFIGLGFEMLWVRVLMIVNKSTAYGFPSILFIYLLGLALGGAVWGRRADKSKDPVLLFCKIELSGAVLAAFTFLAFWWSLKYNPPWIHHFLETQKPGLPFVRIDHEWIFSRRALLAMLWQYFLPLLIIVLPTSFVLGGGLPVLDRLSINNPSLSGRRVGDIHLANIIGSVVGILVISFVLLPSVGTEWALKLLILSTFLFPLFYFLGKTIKSPRRSEYSLAGISLIALVGVLLLPRSGEFYTRLYFSGTGQETVISESGDSVLVLTYEPGSSRQTGLFWIGGEVNSFFPPKGIYEGRALACAGTSKPERILIIGFGGGYSALFYTALPDVKEIVIVELLGDIEPFLYGNLESARRTLDDPRITYIVDDGRRYLNAYPDEKFDLISIDPLREHTAGHNNLYSEEALRIYQNHLTSNGILCAWMQEKHIVPHTTATVFPFVDQFRSEFMIAGNNPIVYHAGYMEQAAESYKVLTGELYGPGGGITLSIDSTLDTFLRSREQILEDEKGMPILRDLHPRLEYYFLVKPVPQNIPTNPDQVENFKNRIQR